MSGRLSGQLDWERDGLDWPNRDYSRFADAGGLRWHVQVAGNGPVVLLIHGTGASTHSFRALLPLLAPHFTVIAPDLPGHGFTTPPATGAGYSLPRVAAGVASLLGKLGLKPAIAVGHSAGAAIAVRMTLDRTITPIAVVSLNGALMPFPGMSNDVFRPVVRLVAGSRVAAKAFTLFAGSRRSAERLVRSTGSRIDAEGMRLYAQLTANAGHVHGALALMANWDLGPLVRDMPHLPARLILVTGSRDGMVPPSESFRVRALFPKAELVSLPGLGHLAHEERPAEIATLLDRIVHGDPTG